MCSIAWNKTLAQLTKSSLSESAASLTPILLAGQGEYHPCSANKNVSNGHSSRLRVAFQELHVRFNLMEACSVLPIILSLHKNTDRSSMALLVCCMRPVSAIAVDAS